MTYVGPSQVLVKPLQGDSRGVILRSQFGHEIDDVRIMGQDRYLVARTPDTLLLGQLPTFFWEWYQFLNNEASACHCILQSIEDINLFWFQTNIDNILCTICFTRVISLYKNQSSGYKTVSQTQKHNNLIYINIIDVHILKILLLGLMLKIIFSTYHCVIKPLTCCTGAGCSKKKKVGVSN